MSIDDPDDSPFDLSDGERAVTVEMLVVMCLFPLGRLVATPAALAALEKAGDSFTKYLAQHARGEWGGLDAVDHGENDKALIEGGRLMSAYSLSDLTRIWIMTESDRSLTTILLPGEY